jgi:hypothetical protein
MSVEVKRIVPENPLDWALGKIGMTRAAFGAEIGFGKSYLIRVSQGRHSHIGTAVEAKLYKLAEAKGIDLDGEILGIYGPATNLDEAYDHWVVMHREAQELPEPVRDTKLNPFQRLVTAAGGVARMSALLAAPDPLVERYAKGKTYRMPLPVMEALNDLNYPHINALDEAMRKWGEK